MTLPNKQNKVTESDDKVIDIHKTGYVGSVRWRA